MANQDIFKLKNINIVSSIFWSNKKIEESFLVEQIVSFLNDNDLFFRPTKIVVGHNGRKKTIKADCTIEVKNILEKKRKPIYLIQYQPFQAMFHVDLDYSVDMQKHQVYFYIDEDWFLDDVSQKSRFFLNLAKNLYNSIDAYYGYCHQLDDASSLWCLRRKFVWKKIRGAYWATFIGPQEVLNMGKSFIAASPAHIIDFLDNGGICILAGKNPIECQWVKGKKILMSINDYLASRGDKESDFSEELKFQTARRNIIDQKVNTLIQRLSEADIEFDHTLESLKKLDQILAQSEEIDDLVEEIGIYVGHVIIGLLGGKWGRLNNNELLVIMHSDNSISNPLAKVYKYFAEGKTDSLAWYVEGLVMVRGIQS